MREVAEKIAAEIRDQGVIPFARFMELALYCPVYGYYETEADTLGRRGDYFTSVSVGPLFGELLAWQFAEWRTKEGSGLVDAQALRQRPGGGFAAAPLRLAEAGAHCGELAADILSWLREQRPAVFESVEYCILEPSERRRQFQAERLAQFAGKVRWVKSVCELLAAPGRTERADSGAGIRGFRGVIFSNELLDSMPVNRLGWDARQRMWFEWGVTGKPGGYIWARMAPGRGEGEAIRKASRWVPEEVLELLPDGFTIEICLAAERWWHEAASALEYGRLLTIDYGLNLLELLSPTRTHGTLRGYRGHRFQNDVLASPGEQDITAHVNFTAIQRAGEAAGLKTDAFVAQSEFLTQIASGIWQGADEGLAQWTAAKTRQFQTLTHPEHLGQRFRVLLQSRDGR